MSAEARVGFHAAYSSETGQETGVGNALIGAYLNKIGLPYSAVIYITQAAPNSMTWLSIADAEKQGIDVEPLSSGQIVHMPSHGTDQPKPRNSPSIKEQADEPGRELLFRGNVQIRRTPGASMDTNGGRSEPNARKGAARGSE